MKTRIYETFESLGSVGWLLMDFCWMAEFKNVCWYVTAIPLFFLTASVIFYNKESKSERIVLLSSLSWFLMNMLWMMHDLTENKDWLLLGAKICFGIAIIFVILAFYFARKENKKIDFRRMKIS